MPGLSREAQPRPKKIEPLRQVLLPRVSILSSYQTSFPWTTILCNDLLPPKSIKGKSQNKASQMPGDAVTWHSKTEGTSPRPSMGQPRTSIIQKLFSSTWSSCMHFQKYKPFIKKTKKKKYKPQSSPMVVDSRIQACPPTKEQRLFWEVKDYKFFCLKMKEV